MKYEFVEFYPFNKPQKGKEEQLIGIHFERNCISSSAFGGQRLISIPGNINSLVRKSLASSFENTTSIKQRPAKRTIANHHLNRPPPPDK
ncbi:MAG: hypothetical protein ACSNEK_09505 [Parachlamydiaceae bacterium]